jgi:hypothetical protein
MKYFKALNSKDEVFFVEIGESDILPKQRIEAAGWDCLIVEITKQEYMKLAEKINAVNKAFIG